MRRGRCCSHLVRKVQLLLPVLADCFAKSRLVVAGSATMQMTGSKMWGHVGHGARGEGVLMPERLVAPHMILLLVRVVMVLLRLTMVLLLLLLLRIRLLKFVCHARLHISLMARPAVHHHMLALLVILTEHTIRVMRCL